MALDHPPLCRQIGLTKSRVTIVDDKDYERLSKHKWCVSSNGYACRFGPRPNRKFILMHRLIEGLDHGDPRQVDHINHDTLDNRSSNLRVTTGQGNQQNRRSRGYYLNKRNGKYHAQIRLNGKRIHLGFYATSFGARAAYLRGKEKYHLLRA